MSHCFVKHIKWPNIFDHCILFLILEWIDTLIWITLTFGVLLVYLVWMDININGYSWSRFVHLLHDWSEASDIISFITMVENHYDTQVKNLMQNNVFQSVETFFKYKGKVYKTSCSYSHSQNGVDVTRDIMFQRMFQNDYGENLLTSVFLITKMTTSVQGQTPIANSSQNVILLHWYSELLIVSALFIIMIWM